MQNVNTAEELLVSDTSSKPFQPATNDVVDYRLEHVSIFIQPF